VTDHAAHSYYKYICRLRGDSGIEIARFIAAVAAEGLPISRRYSTPLPQQPVFRNAGLAGAACPVAERLSSELFTLLVHPTASVADMDDYVTAIAKVSRALTS
jgi:dTDP-4-amino-4,6-dideoxygalactose transaminase